MQVGPPLCSLELHQQHCKKDCWLLQGSQKVDLIWTACTIMSARSASLEVRRNHLKAEAKHLGVYVGVP